MAECQSFKKNMAVCTCTYEPCPRKGHCCECLQYHWPMKQMPACMFPPEVERMFDRSLKRFLQCHAA